MAETLPDNPAHGRHRGGANPLFSDSPMTDAELKAEITDGPLAPVLADSWAAGDDTRTAYLLNDTTTGRTRPRDLPHGEFVGWMIRTDTIDAVEAAQTEFTHADPTTQATIRQVCKRAVRVFNTPALSILDADELAPLAVVLAAVEVITDTRRDSLLALISEPCSRAQELGSSITPDDIGRARLHG